MLYKEPFVLYLNISVCAILLFLALPSLLNRREEVKVRLAFSLIFFVVIATCIINLVVLYSNNYKLAFLGFFVFFISLLFGPAIYYYVKTLLGSKVSKGIYFSLVPGIASVAYGIYLGISNETHQQKIFQQMLSGEHLFYEITNLLTLILTLIYCVKAWMFIKKVQRTRSESLSSPHKLKLTWAREFIVYMFANVFIFLILVLVLTNASEITTMDMDLIGMPVFMLFVYLLVAIRSMMMYKEFEHQFVLAGIENDKQIQDQRLDIARDLHDSLGAHLTFIASVSDGLKKNSENLDDHLKAKVSSLSDFTENSIAELKNALWILNSNEITLDDIRSKILNFIKAAGEAKEEVQFHFQFELKENRAVNSKWAVNLFRIVQEIINNAAKYAQAKDLWIEMEQINKALKLKIQDNGIGFDIDAVKPGSYGLSNLRQRVQDMDGQLLIESVPGKGTTFLIELILK